jgi:hypothetical protein
VETEVELAVACARKPVVDTISRRHIDWGGAGVGGERRGGAESIDRAVCMSEAALAMRRSR